MGSSRWGDDETVLPRLVGNVNGKKGTGGSIVGRAYRWWRGCGLMENGRMWGGEKE